LEGYEPQDVTPWETASGGHAAAVTSADGHGTLQFTYSGDPGNYHLNWMYYDQRDGNSRYRLLVGNQPVDEWVADDNLPDNKPSGHTATRHTTPAVALHPGDTIRLEATADGGEHACVDYVEILPAAD
jgi:alpha-glucuronidase